MKFIKIIVQVAILYIFYFIGDWIGHLFHLPIPGSIIGLLLLFLALVLKVFPLKWIETGAGFLQVFLPLFFVPASIGIIDYLHLFAGSGLLLVVAVILSTFIVLITAGYTSEILVSWENKKRKRKACQE